MDKTKYINAILFFANNTSDLGKVKLNKLLYYLDFDHFEKYGNAITNDTYINKQLGPVPSHIDEILYDMVHDRLIYLNNEQVIDYTRYRIVPFMKYNPIVFTSTEVAMLCEVNDKWGHLTAREIVLASHGEAPWIATREGEEIPYALAYYRGKYEDSKEKSDIEEEVKVN